MLFGGRAIPVLLYLYSCSTCIEKLLVASWNQPRIFEVASRDADHIDTPKRELRLALGQKGSK